MKDKFRKGIWLWRIRQKLKENKTISPSLPGSSLYRVIFAGHKTPPSAPDLSSRDPCRLGTAHQWRLHLTQESALGKAGRSLWMTEANKTSNDEKNKTDQQKKKPPPHYVKIFTGAMGEMIPVLFLPSSPADAQGVELAVVRYGPGEGQPLLGSRREPTSCLFSCSATGPVQE